MKSHIRKSPNAADSNSLSPASHTSGQKPTDHGTSASTHSGCSSHEGACAAGGHVHYNDGHRHSASESTDEDDNSSDDDSDVEIDFSPPAARDTPTNVATISNQTPPTESALLAQRLQHSLLTRSPQTALSTLTHLTPPHSAGITIESSPPRQPPQHLVSGGAHLTPFNSIPLQPQFSSSHPMSPFPYNFSATHPHQPNALNLGTSGTDWHNNSPLLPPTHMNSLEHIPPTQPINSVFDGQMMNNSNNNGVNLFFDNEDAAIAAAEQTAELMGQGVDAGANPLQHQHLPQPTATSSSSAIKQQQQVASDGSSNNVPSLLQRRMADGALSNLVSPTSLKRAHRQMIAGEQVTGNDSSFMPTAINTANPNQQPAEGDQSWQLHLNYDVPEWARNAPLPLNLQRQTQKLQVSIS